jgi:hypothetical protein
MIFSTSLLCLEFESSAEAISSPFVAVVPIELNFLADCSGTIKALEGSIRPLCEIGISDIIVVTTDESA